MPLTPEVSRRGESLGRYVVLRQIGSGGMGVVYAAYDPELDRRVALKVLAAAASEETGPARLLREAQTMARISHPNVITVHDVGEVDGRLFIAMELVDGVDLKQWLSEGGHPWEEVLEVLVQAGRGLAAAHDQGLIHRDFKPANVLVGKDGLVRVLDFGLARRFGSGGDELQVSDTGDVEVSTSLASHTEQLTRTGAVAGTPAYMSPEQHARAELDAKSDQFSFCITAFEALFGERPFKGTGRMGLMLATTQGDRQPVPKSSPVPSRIADAVLRGLEPKPDDRWADMRALLGQLEHKPAARRSRVLGAVTVVAVGSIIALSLGDDAADPCSTLATTALLPDAARADVRAAFSNAEVPYADEALATRPADPWMRTRATGLAPGWRCARPRGSATTVRRPCTTSRSRAWIAAGATSKQRSACCAKPTCRRSRSRRRSCVACPRSPPATT
jgi:tRNA A-37 threonylcarbamoyl transferase component Bud32